MSEFMGMAVSTLILLSARIDPQEEDAKGCVVITMACMCCGLCPVAFVVIVSAMFNATYAHYLFAPFFVSKLFVRSNQAARDPLKPPTPQAQP